LIHCAIKYYYWLMHCAIKYYYWLIHCAINHGDCIKIVK
jgi:hypothetical protein